MSFLESIRDSLASRSQPPSYRWSSAIGVALERWGDPAEAAGWVYRTNVLSVVDPSSRRAAAQLLLGESVTPRHREVVASRWRRFFEELGETDPAVREHLRRVEDFLSGSTQGIRADDDTLTRFLTADVEIEEACAYAAAVFRSEGHGGIESRYSDVDYLRWTLYAAPALSAIDLIRAEREQCAESPPPEATAALPAPEMRS